VTSKLSYLKKHTNVPFFHINKRMIIYLKNHQNLLIKFHTFKSWISFHNWVF